ncbi:YbaB/EbfC family nucleoid-associated protein [Actinomadura fulvescens]|uniref:YbaB/EbfC DNA-binding family protein n=1 Tax=Actinomadura fulvescens TaxID=46160 RepID=A0ABN3Q3Z0_9ACTN
MSHESATEDLDRLLSSTISAAAEAGGPRDETGDRATELRGEGHDPDRLIRASVAAGGRIETVEIGPRAHRLASHELAERAMAAINAALEDLERATAARSAGAVAGAELTERLREAQDLSMRQLRTYTRSLQDLMNGFESR